MLASIAATAHADVAPTKFVGYGISPVDAHGLRMVSAQVDITWGTPCTLSAAFIIENQTAQPADIQLGFPVTNIYYQHRDGIVPNALTFAFDGVPSAPSNITVKAQSDNKPAGSAWYYCRHTFLTGSTKVTVKTKLPASLDYNLPYREHLFYCIETGGSWEGTIGSEEVDIHFPNRVTQEQIIDANPTSYKIDGSTVRWQFKDFKPKGQDHDIDIEFLRPDVISVLARVRAENSSAPSNSARILKFAKDLFALGPYKGYAPYPPYGLSQEEFTSFLAKIQTTRDRARFQSFYIVNAQGKYEESESSWDSDRPETLRILNAIDYQPPDDQSPYVNEAKGLVEKLLKDQPANAEAWNVYFANYYRFHFAGGSYETGTPTYYPHETQQIKKAIALCPRDPCLKLWHEVITNPTFQDADAPDVIALNQQIKKQGILDNDYPKFNYDYH